MSVVLLDNTRKIGRLLHNNSSFVVVFNDICRCIGDILNANVMVVSAKGKVLGIFEKDGLPFLHDMLSDRVGKIIDPVLNERFLSVLSTKENVNLATLGFEEEENRDFSAVIMPIDFAGERMGTTFIYRPKKEFEVDDIILAEYANTVIELEMMRSLYEEDIENKRKTEVVRAAMESLSASEKESIGYIFKELDAREGLLVASSVAKKYNITRSIIVNAIRKLEGAGIIESKSQGMRGTYLKVLNDALFEWSDEGRRGKE